MKTPSFIVCAGFVGLVLAGCGKSPEALSLATVNGEKITMQEFYNYLERKQRVAVAVNNQSVELPVIGSLGLQAMRDLINRRILLQIAKDDGLAPTPADVKKELEFQQKRQPDFVKRLQLAGLTMEQIRSDLALDIARERILGKGIDIKEADVDAYIKANPDDPLLKRPATADVYWILVKKPEIKALVDQDLREGQPFKTIAQRYSQAPDARNSEGRFPENEIPRMPPALQTLIAKTPDQKATEWIADQGGTFIRFFIEKRAKAETIPVTDITREVLKRRIRIERGTQGSDLNSRLQAKLRNSTIAVQVPYLQQPWRQAFEALKAEDAQKKEATTSTTPGQ